MLLTVDIGNSNTVVGVFDRSELTHRWRVSTDTTSTPDELALVLAGLLRFADLELGDLHGVAIASVVPTVTEIHREMVAEYLPFDPLVVAPGVRSGLSLRVDNPREIGADRIVNAVAAHALYGAPSVVVDFGTATSFDAVDREGRFVGGAIAPGIRISTEALADMAAQLPRVETRSPETAIGRSTVTALQSGIVFGFAGQVDAIVDRIVDELGPGVTTVATGGLAPSVLSACRTLDHHDPALTLKGLRLVWERNQ